MIFQLDFGTVLKVWYFFFPFYYINNISIEFGVFLCQTDFVGVVPEIHIHDNGKKGGGSE
jgi:hypothetical protein